MFRATNLVQHLAKGARSAMVRRPPIVVPTPRPAPAAIAATYNNQTFRSLSTTNIAMSKKKNIGMLLSALTAAGATMSYAYNEGNSALHFYTLDEITHLIAQGKTIIAVGDEIYDITEFVNSHPGGCDVLKAANGHNILSLWESPAYQFHLSSQTVKGFLEKYRIGQGTLPLLSVEGFNQKLVASKLNPNDYYVHDLLNADIKSLVFNPITGATEMFFARSHNALPSTHCNLTLTSQGQKIELDNTQLGQYPHKPLFHLISCGGAGRSKYQAKYGKQAIAGISWGKNGPDAFGTMSLSVISLRDIFTHNAINFPNESYVIKVTGSDGQFATLHSSELDNLYLSIENSDGTELDELHGRERRLIVIGSPGFRNIKSVANIEILPELSEAEITSTLINRLKNPMEMLGRVTRMLLAMCPKYDAYVEKDIHTQQVVGFRLYFPISCTILDTERTATGIKLRGFAYSGQALVKEVIIHSPELPMPILATLKRPLHGDGHFEFWEVELPAHVKTVTATATDTNGHTQPVEYPVCARGLYNYGGQQTITL